MLDGHRSVHFWIAKHKSPQRGNGRRHRKTVTGSFYWQLQSSSSSRQAYNTKHKSHYTLIDILLITREHKKQRAPEYHIHAVHKSYLPIS